jgi:hypothetical protein
VSKKGEAVTLHDKLKEIEARYPSKSVMRRLETMAPGKMAEDMHALLAVTRELVKACEPKKMPVHSNLVGTNYHDGIADQLEYHRKQANDALARCEKILEGMK